MASLFDFDLSNYDYEPEPEPEAPQEEKKKSSWGLPSWEDYVNATSAESDMYAPQKQAPQHIPTAEERIPKLSSAEPETFWQKAAGTIDDFVNPHTPGTMAPAEIADAQIKREARTYGKDKGPDDQGLTDITPLTKEAYMDEVDPENSNVRKATQLFKDVGVGALSTAEGMAGAVEWVSDGLIGGDLANQAKLWSQDLTGEEQGFSNQLAQGAGSMATFFIPGMGVAKGATALAKVSPKLANWLGASTMTAMEAATEAGSVYREVIEKTRDPLQASVAATQAFTLNLPLLIVTNKLGMFGEQGKALKRVLVSSYMEGTQEAGQELISTDAAGRDVKWGDVLTSGVIGGIMGGVGGGLAHTILPTQIKGDLKDDQVNDIEKAKASLSISGTDAGAQYARTLIEKGTIADLKNALQADNPLPWTPMERLHLENHMIRLQATESPSAKIEKAIEDLDAGKISSGNLIDVLAGQMADIGSVIRGEDFGVEARKARYDSRQIGLDFGADGLPLFNPQDRTGQGEIVQNSASGEAVDSSMISGGSTIPFDGMVKEAARWRGAALNVDEALGNDKQARLAHSHITTKGDLDAYLMRKYGIDATTARNVSNELTDKNIPADRSAKPEDFKGEPWAKADMPDLEIYHRSHRKLKGDVPDFDAFFGDKEFSDTFKDEFGKHEYKLTVPKAIAKNIVNLLDGSKQSAEIMADIIKTVYPDDPDISKYIKQIQSGDQNAIEEFYDTWTDKDQILPEIRKRGLAGLSFRGEYILTKETIKASHGAGKKPATEKLSTQGKKAKTRSTIAQAMESEYGDAKDITEEWKALSPAEKQKAVADGLHIETDRSGKRVLGNLSQKARQDRLRAAVTSKQKNKKTSVESPRGEYGDDEKVTRLVTKPLREAHKKLQDEIKDRLREKMEKVSAYDGWKWEIGDRVKSKKTGKVWEVTAKSWNDHKNVPSYFMRTRGVKDGEESGMFYAEPSHDAFIHLNGQITSIKEADAEYGEPKKADAFYSQMAQVLDKKLPNQGTPAQFRTMINAWAQKGEFKAEELKWSGVDEWLAGKKDKITKKEVVYFIKENQIQIKEITKGTPRAYGPEDNTVYSTPKFSNSNLQLPGGENYKELLLTLPVITEDTVAEKELQKAGLRIQKDGANRRAVDKSGTLVIAQDVDTEFQHQEGRRATDEEQKAIVAARQAKGTDSYRSGHFDEPNILLHVRMNDRTDADGKRVLFLEELQSDWHQEGRQKGYTQAGAKPKAAILESNDGTGWYRLFNPEMTKSFPYIEREEAEYAARAQGWEPVNEVVRPNKTVPPAPFSKTWHELGMKRMLRYAAENGYDRLAWTTGEQQAERYDLSKQLDAVEYSSHPSGYFLRATDKGDHGVLAQSYSEEELPGVVGKELAEKIVNGIGTETRPGRWGGMEKKLSGLDLKVGGEGMAGFYDKMLPSFMNKYVKKWGAKVGETAIPREESKSWKTIDATTPEGVKQLEGWGKTIVHSVDITDAMRKDVLAQGQALYEPKANYGKPAPSFYSNTEEMLNKQTETAMPPAEWKKRIEAWGEKFPGIREEIKWSGILEMIEGRMGDKKITKADLLNQIEESKKGWLQQENEPDRRWSSRNLPGAIPGTEQMWIYSKPGRRGGRELSKDVSTRRLAEEDLRYHSSDMDAWAVAPLQEMINNGSRIAGDWGHFSRRGELLWMTSAADASDRAEARQEFLEYLEFTGVDEENDLTIPIDSAAYSSPHFTTKPNVLLHIRTQKMRDDQGRIGIIAETIQSDWHQEGRQKGYAQPEEAKFRAEFDLIQGWFSQQEIDDAKKRGRKVRILETRETTPGVPDAPFKDTWHEQGLKRLIDIATKDPEVEWIGWTPGEAQGERWGKLERRYIGKVEYAEGDGDKYGIDVQYKRQDQIDLYGSDDAKWIVNHFNGTLDQIKMKWGSEVADAIRNKEGLQSQAESSGDAYAWGIAELNRNVSAGGDYLKLLYDKKLPKFANKYVKKWGAKVEDITTSGTEMGITGLRADLDPSDSSRRYWIVVNGRGDVLAERLNPIAAKEYVENLQRDAKSKQQTIHAITITPQMREEITTKGQAFYEPQATYATKAINVLKKAVNFFTARLSGTGLLNRSGKDADGNAGGVRGEKKRHHTVGKLIDDLKELKMVRLRGIEVKTWDQVYDALRITRNKNVEILQVLYIGKESGKVLYNEACSSRLPGAVHIASPEILASAIHATTLSLRKISGEGVKVTIAHNHPSGDVTASGADTTMTSTLADLLQRKYQVLFGGHIIIDHNKYNIINSLGDTEQHSLEAAETKDPLLTIPIPSPKLGKTLTNQAHIAAIAKDINRGNKYFTLLMRSGTRIRGIVNIELGILEDPKQAHEYIKNLMVNHGAQDAFVYREKFDNKQIDALINLVEGNAIRDAAWDTKSGTTGLREEGFFPNYNRQFGRDISDFQGKWLEDYSNEFQEGNLPLDPPYIRESEAPYFTAPEKTITAYKIFETKKNRPGEIFPLFIGKKKATPIGEWLIAEFLPTEGYAERPGWHAGKYPEGDHLRQKSTGKYKPTRVWAEVELPADVDWQAEANKNTTKDIKGKIPANGHYVFKVAKSQGWAWLIGGAIKVNRLLTNEERIKILRKNNLPVNPRDLEGSSVQEPGAEYGSNQTDTTAFKTWFGDSKVVDDSGKPLVVYHTASKYFMGKDGKPIYVESEEDQAESFSEFITETETGAHFGSQDQANDIMGGHTYPIYLKIESPIRLEDSGGFSDAEVINQLLSKGLISKDASEIEADAQPLLKRLGYDGVVYLNRREGIGDSIDGIQHSYEDITEMEEQDFRELYPNAKDSYIAFSPNQIKSATANRGTFDPNEDSILKEDDAPYTPGEKSARISPMISRKGTGDIPPKTTQQPGGGEIIPQNFIKEALKYGDADSFYNSISNVKHTLELKKQIALKEGEFQMFKYGEMQKKHPYENEQQWSPEEQRHAFEMRGDLNRLRDELSTIETIKSYPLRTIYELLPDDIFVRFNKPPRTKKSKNYQTGEELNGLSTLEGRVVEFNGKYGIKPADLSDTGTIEGYVFQGRPAALYTGEVVGYGPDGEPLIANYKKLYDLRINDDGNFSISGIDVKEEIKRLYRSIITDLPNPSRPPKTTQQPEGGGYKALQGIDGHFFKIHKNEYDSGDWYVTGIEGKKLNTTNRTMWVSKDEVQAEYFTNKGRGIIVYSKPKKGSKILDLTDENSLLDFAEKINELADAGHPEFHRIVDEYRGLGAKDIAEVLHPEDIVEHGKIWDDDGFSNSVWDSFGYDFIKTHDGGIFLNPSAAWVTKNRPMNYGKTTDLPNPSRPPKTTQQPEGGIGETPPEANYFSGFNGEPITSADQILPYGKSFSYRENYFGGIFAGNEEVAGSHGDNIQKFYVPEELVMPHDAMSMMLYDQDESQKLLTTISEVLKEFKYETLSDEELSEMADYLSEEKSLPEDEPDMGAERMSEILGKDISDGETLWDIQGLRGEVARRLGYAAVEMEDEHGISTLILNHPKVQFLPNPSRPPEVGGRATEPTIIREDDAPYGDEDDSFDFGANMDDTEATIDENPFEHISTDFKDHLDFYISELNSLVQQGEPGRKMATDEGETISWSSTYPEFMQDQGWTSKEVLSALSHASKGEKMTEKQREIVEAAINQAVDMFYEDLDRWSMSSDQIAKAESSIQAATDALLKRYYTNQATLKAEKEKIDRATMVTKSKYQWEKEKQAQFIKGHEKGATGVKAVVTPIIETLQEELGYMTRQRDRKVAEAQRLLEKLKSTDQGQQEQEAETLKEIRRLNSEITRVRKSLDLERSKAKAPKQTKKARKSIIRIATGMNLDDEITISEMTLLKSQIRREAAAARTAMRIGNKEGLLTARMKYKLLMDNLRARREARKEVNTIIKDLKKVSKQTATMTPEYQKVIDEVLAPFTMTGMTEQTKTKLENLRDALVKNKEMDLPDSVIESLGRLDKKPLRDLDSTSLRNIHAAVMHFAALGKRGPQMILSQKKVTRDFVKDQSIKEMRPAKQVADEMDATYTAGKEAKGRLATLKNMYGVHLDTYDNLVESIAGQNGMAYRVLMREIKRGSNERDKIAYSLEDDFMEAQEAFKKRHPKITNMAGWLNEDVTFAGIKMQRNLAISLYRGFYDADFQRSIAENGFGLWGNQDINHPNKIFRIPGELYGNAVNKMTNIEKEYGDLAISTIERSGDLLAEKFLEINGYAMPRVQGIYWRKEVMASERAKDEELELQKERFDRPHIFRGMTEQRTGSSAAVWVKPFTVSVREMHNRAADYVGLEEAMSNAAWLLYNPTFKGELEARYGLLIWREIEKGLKDIAQISSPEAKTDMERFFRWLRNKSTIYALAANYGTALKQLNGSLNYMVYVPPGYLTQAISTYSKDPMAVKKLHREMSVEYRKRREGGYSQDIGNVLSALNQQGREATLSEKIGQKGMVPLQYVDIFGVDLGMLAATYQAMDCFKNGEMSDHMRMGLEVTDAQVAQMTPAEKMALAYRWADFVTERTQGMFLPEHMSGWQRGTELEKQCSMFFGELQKNLAGFARAYRAVKRGEPGAKALLTKTILLYAILGVLIDSGVNELRNRLRGRKGDKWWAALLKSYTGYLPVIREVASSVIDYSQGKFYGQGGGDTPFARTQNMVAKPLTYLAATMTAKTPKKQRENAMRLAKAMMDVISLTFGIPWPAMQEPYKIWKRKETMRKERKSR